MSSKSQVSVDNFLCQLFVFFYDQALTLKIDLCFIYDIILANEQKDVVIGTCPYFATYLASGVRDAAAYLSSVRDKVACHVTHAAVAFFKGHAS